MSAARTGLTKVHTRSHVPKIRKSLQTERHPQKKVRVAKPGTSNGDEDDRRPLVVERPPCRRSSRKVGDSSRIRLMSLRTPKCRCCRSAPDRAPSRKPPEGIDLTKVFGVGAAVRRRRWGPTEASIYLSTSPRRSLVARRRPTAPCAPAADAWHHPSPPPGSGERKSSRLSRA